ncbi:MAG: pilus assembly FimT family protein [Nitrospirota bacterium]
MKQERQDGFSLVEVLITIAIITIVLTIAIPSFQGYAINRNLKAAARSIESDIFELKERAIAENRQYRMTFTVGTGTYTIDQCTVTGSSCPAWQAPVGIQQNKTLALFDNSISITNAAFAGGVPTVIFQTRGTVNGAGGSVTITNSRGSSAVIAVNITGRASVRFDLQ